jgi:peptidoglycan hydrolase-like protein with peptidoglycan-binding domain
MSIGSRSDEVKALQDTLKALGHLDPSISSTGYFGNLTAAAVKKFQTANGISPVGFVGPATRAALNR